jgi:hypothetical protein
MLAALVVVASAGLASAATAVGEDDDESNAATWYRRAFERVRAIPDDAWILLVDYDGQAPPSPAVRALLGQVRPALELMRRAAHQPSADFGLDYSAGIQMELPHLQPMRSLARLARADAMVRMNDGDYAGAAGLIGDAYRMSSQLRADGTVISSMVGQAIFQLSDSLSARGLDEGVLDAAASAKLLESMNGLRSIDPFNYVEAVTSERDVFGAWVKETYSAEGGIERMKEDMKFDTDAALEVRHPELALLTRDQFDAAFGQYEAVMTRVVEAFGSRDTEQARAELEQLTRELQQGVHGPIAAVLTPAWEKVYEAMVKSEETLRERRNLLQAIASGRLTPERAANAAVLYLKAIEWIRTLPPEALNALVAYAEAMPVEAAAPLPEDLAAALRDTEPIRALLRGAAAMERCDFSIARENRASVAWPYQAGLRQAGRILLAGAVASLAAREPDRARDQITSAFRMAAHLAGDRQITSSLIAHELFLATGELAIHPWAELVPGSAARRAGAAAHASDEARADPAINLGRFRGRDPFGAIEAVARQRKELKVWLRRSLTGREPANVRSMDQWVDSMSANPVFAVIAATASFEAAASNGESAALGVSDDVRRLDGIVSPEGVLEAQLGAAQLRSALEAGNRQVLQALQLPRIAEVEVRAAEGPADVARLTAALGAPGGAAPAPAGRPPGR